MFDRVLNTPLFYLQKINLPQFYLTKIFPTIFFFRVSGVSYSTKVYHQKKYLWKGALYLFYFPKLKWSISGSHNLKPQEYFLSQTFNLSTEGTEKQMPDLRKREQKKDKKVTQ